MLLAPRFVYLDPLARWARKADGVCGDKILSIRCKPNQLRVPIFDFQISLDIYVSRESDRDRNCPLNLMLGYMNAEVEGRGL